MVLVLVVEVVDDLRELRDLFGHAVLLLWGPRGGGGRFGHVWQGVELRPAETRRLTDASRTRSDASVSFI
jgi:hypothetical protein